MRLAPRWLLAAAALTIGAAPVPPPARLGADAGGPIEPADVMRLLDTRAARISPDGRTVLFTVQRQIATFSPDRSTIWSVPADGSAPARLLTASAGADGEPRWSPDGRSVAFLSNRKNPLAGRADAGSELRPDISAAPGAPVDVTSPTTPEQPGEPSRQIWLLPAAGGKALPLTALPNDVSGLAWSPDGRRIAFESLDLRGEETSDIWVTRADGSHGRLVAQCRLLDCVELSYPSFSPNGEQLITVQFDRDARGVWGASHLVTVDLRTGAQRIVASTADVSTAFVNPRWSPDGRSLAVEVQTYHGDDWLGSAIDIVQVRSGSSRRIVPSSMFAGHPDFRRSDGLIVFDTYDLSATGETDEDSNLFTVHPNGQGLRRLTSTRNADGVRLGEPTWTPDGRSISAAIGIVKQIDDSRVVVDAHLASVAYPSGSITDTGVSGARPRQQPCP